MRDSAGTKSGYDEGGSQNQTEGGYDERWEHTGRFGGGNLLGTGN